MKLFIYKISVSSKYFEIFTTNISYNDDITSRTVFVLSNNVYLKICSYNNIFFKTNFTIF